MFNLWNEWPFHRRTTSIDRSAKFIGQRAGQFNDQGLNDKNNLGSVILDLQNDRPLVGWASLEMISLSQSFCENSSRMIKNGRNDRNEQSNEQSTERPIKAEAVSSIMLVLFSSLFVDLQHC